MSQPLSENPGGSASILAQLTDRQLVCLRLASEGLSSRQIAQHLGVSARTVDDHFLTACQVLGVRTRIQAVAILIWAGGR